MSGDAGKIVVRVSRRFDASRGRGFDAWLGRATIGNAGCGCNVCQHHQPAQGPA